MKKRNYEKVLNNFFRNGDDNHYVYALCDSNNRIFYVGEGTGARCLAHKGELEKERKEIEKLPKEERSKRLTEFSEKKRMINKIGPENVKHIILKYGLSQDEGFIAESSVINALKAIGIELTNVVNGHATLREKESKSVDKTKARDLETFVKECAPEILDVRRMNKKFLSESIFISINRAYPWCKDKEDVWDATRGLWRMSLDKANKCRYVIAVSNQIIRGVFEVEPGHVKEVFSSDNTMIPKRPTGDFGRKTDYKLGKIISKHYMTAKSKKQLIKNIIADKQIGKWCYEKLGASSKKELYNRLNNYLARKYFTERITEREDILNEKYANKCLVLGGEDFKMPQGSIRYGADLV